MSINLNVAHIAGRLTRDPELKALPSGQSIANLSIATNHTYTNKEGEKKDIAEYHNVIIFGKQAENTAKYMQKGHTVLVSGRIQTRMYEKDGARHYRTEIIADSIQFGDKQEAPTIGSTDVEYPQPDDTNDPRFVPF
jgi:single-strand DNA-binding protein